MTLQLNCALHVVHLIDSMYFCDVNMFYIYCDYLFMLSIQCCFHSFMLVKDAREYW